MKEQLSKASNREEELKEQLSEYQAKYEQQQQQLASLMMVLQGMQGLASGGASCGGLVSLEGLSMPYLTHTALRFVRTLDDACSSTLPPVASI